MAECSHSKKRRTEVVNISEDAEESMVLILPSRSPLMSYFSPVGHFDQWIADD